MNVFKFELRSLRIMLLLWALAFVALITIYISVYPSFSKDAAATQQLFATLPFAVHAALGMNVETLFSFLGFLGNVFTVILLASAMFGASLGLGLFSREGRARTTDFLLTKPRRRSSIFFAKTGNSACIWRASVIFYHGMKRAVLCRRCPEKGGAPRK